MEFMWLRWSSLWKKAHRWWSCCQPCASWRQRSRLLSRGRADWQTFSICHHWMIPLCQCALILLLVACSWFRTESRNSYHSFTVVVLNVRCELWSECDINVVWESIGKVMYDTVSWWLAEHCICKLFDSIVIAYSIHWVLHLPPSVIGATEY